MASRDRLNAATALAVVRIACGLVMLRGGRDAGAQTETLGETISQLVSSGLAERWAPLRTWADAVLLENPDATAFLWRVGLMTAGLALTLGVLVRPACALAVVLVLHGWWFGPAESHALHFVLLACMVVLGLAGAGRTLGFDAALDRGAPRWLTWAPPRRGDIF